MFKPGEKLRCRYGILDLIDDKIYTFKRYNGTYHCNKNSYNYIYINESQLSYNEQCFVSVREERLKKLKKLEICSNQVI